MTSTLDASPTLWQTRPGWGISVDLTPPEVLQGRQVRGLQRGIGAALVLVLLLCVCASVLTLHRQSVAQDTFDAEQAHTAALQADAAKYSDITDIQNALTEIDGQVALVMANDLDFVNLMARIRFSLPDGVTITDEAVTLAPASQTAANAAAAGPTVIGSVTLAGDAPTIRDVAALVTVLSGLKGVTDVIPTSTTRTDKRSLAYTISLNLTDENLSHRFDTAGAK